MKKQNAFLVLAAILTLASCGLTHTHTYGEWVTVSEPNCMNTGVKEHTCSGCGKIETEAIPVDPNKHIEEKETITQATCTDEGDVLVYCMLCEKELRHETTGALGHNWGSYVVDEEPTCQKEGLEHRTCLRCGEVDTKIIEKSEHYGEYINVDPTCEEDGYWGYFCSDCGELIDPERYEEYPAYGHSYGKGVITEVPTKYTTGTITYTCKRSHCDHVKTEIIPKLTYDPSEVYDGVSVAQSYKGGNGSKANPYQISSVAEFMLFRKTTYSNNEYFVLTNDLVFNDISRFFYWWDNRENVLDSLHKCDLLNFYSTGFKSGIHFDGNHHSMIGFYGANFFHDYSTLAEFKNVKLLNFYTTTSLFGYGERDVSPVFSNIEILDFINTCSYGLLYREIEDEKGTWTFDNLTIKGRTRVSYGQAGYDNNNYIGGLVKTCQTMAIFSKCNVAITFSGDEVQQCGGLMFKLEYGGSLIVKDCTIENKVTISYDYQLGTFANIAAYSYGYVEITNNYIGGSLVGGRAAGLFGEVGAGDYQYSIIKDTVVSTSLTGTHVAGFACDAYNISVKRCSFIGKMIAKGTHSTASAFFRTYTSDETFRGSPLVLQDLLYKGDIEGAAENAALIANNFYLDGIAGEDYYESDVIIQNVFATGSLNGFNTPSYLFDSCDFLKPSILKISGIVIDKEAMRECAYDEAWNVIKTGYGSLSKENNDYLEELGFGSSVKLVEDKDEFKDKATFENWHFAETEEEFKNDANKAWKLLSTDEEPTLWSTYLLSN